MNAMRWGLVTLATGITSGTVGYYLRDPGAATVSVLSISILFAFLGAASISMGEGDHD